MRVEKRVSPGRRERKKREKTHPHGSSTAPTLSISHVSSSSARLKRDCDASAWRGRRNGDGESAATGARHGVGGGVSARRPAAAGSKTTTAGVAAYEKPYIAGSMTSCEEEDDAAKDHLPGPCLGAGVGEAMAESSP